MKEVKVTGMDIVMVVPGLPFDGNTINERSLGGSETSAYYMARELAKLGHYVTLFTNTPKGGMFDGVNYRNISGAYDYMSMVPHDICIVQRMPQLFARRSNAKLNILWNHDLGLKRNEADMKGVLWNVDGVFVLSEFMKKQYADVYGLSDSLMWLTRNGIDTALAPIPTERNRKQLVYTSRPERGLDVLLGEVMPRLLEKDPGITLVIGGYDNPVDHMKEFYDHCKALAARLGNAVKYVPPMNKLGLLQLYAESGAYVYPTPSPIMANFKETFCITALECAQAGLPMVTTDIGALPETVLNGKLIKPGQNYIAEFVDAVMRLIENEVQWTQLSHKGQSQVKYYNWGKIAQEWSALFESKIRDNNSSVRRLIRHAWQQSDIVLAENLIAQHRLYDGAAADVPQVDPKLAARIENDFSFYHQPNTHREHYEKIGATHDPIAFDYSNKEIRFEVLAGWLKSKPDIKRALDYGCAHGSYAIHLSNALPDLKITGVDVDQKSIDMARRFMDEGKAKHGTNVLFMQTEEFNKFNLDDNPYDCAIVQEILEHVGKPWELVDEIEQSVSPDGWVYITVPFGPWEYDSYENYPHRCHIWHFDQHDLRDMFKAKKNLAIGSMIHGFSQRLNEPLGWWIIQYQVDGTKTGHIDMLRKAWLQRPTHTVSANIMAGPGAEQQLHWCLSSIQEIVEQIVVVDCGMSDEAKSMALSYGAQIVAGADPKVEGFETPRNIGLEHCVGDFILWIDTDEKLVGEKNLIKYLRSNIFDGYCIRQHHFAIDTQFTPDMPVRLFRRNPPDGKKLRFYGMIHEHPEKVLNEGPGFVIALSDVNVAHTGYIVEDVRRQRFARNFPLLQADMKKYPDRKLQKHFIIRDSVLMAGYEIQQAGGVTDKAKRLCEDAVRLYKENFLGHTSFANVDSLQWYTQALIYLGRGFEVTYGLSAGPDSAKTVEMKTGRFDTLEDFQAELNLQAKGRAAVYEHEYY